VRVMGLVPPADVADDVPSAEGVVVAGNGSLTYACFPKERERECAAGEAWRQVEVRQVRLEPDRRQTGRSWTDLDSSAFSVLIQRGGGGECGGEEGAREGAELGAAGRLARWRQARAREVGAARGGGNAGQEERGQGGEEAGGSSDQGAREESVDRRAVATVVTSLDYFVGALVMFHSLAGACGLRRGGQGIGAAGRRRGGTGGAGRGGPEELGGDMMKDVEMVMVISERLKEHRSRIEHDAEEAGVLVNWVTVSS